MNIFLLLIAIRNYCFGLWKRLDCFCPYCLTLVNSPWIFVSNEVPWVISISSWSKLLSLGLVTLPLINFKKYTRCVYIVPFRNYIFYSGLCEKLSAMNVRKMNFNVSLKYRIIYFLNFPVNHIKSFDGYFCYILYISYLLWIC